LDGEWRSELAENHRRNARKALVCLDVQRVSEPLGERSKWGEVYGELIQKHKIRGIAAFSDASFALQLGTPGLEMWVARHEGQVVGICLWMVQGELAYYHLAAYTPLGYELRASFGLFFRVFEDFESRGICRVNLGGASGVNVSADDGLARFKGGLTSSTQTAYFCGSVLNHSLYEELVTTADTAGVQLFPAYRFGANALK
jgi:hypothetical protein